MSENLKTTTRLVEHVVTIEKEIYRAIRMLIIKTCKKSINEMSWYRNK